MIPCAYVGLEVSFNYIREYINIIHPIEMRTSEDKDDIFAAYSEFLLSLGLTMNEDLFIINTNTIEDSTQEITKDKYLIGAPITTFSPTWSIRRMQLEIYGILSSMDFLVDETHDIVKFYIFNIK